MKSGANASSHPGKEGKTINSKVQGAAEAAENASNSRIFVFIARTGFAVSGCLHILIGILAIQLSMGRAREADQGGALSQLAQQPAGVLLLWIAFTACLALALWQLSETVFGYRTLEQKKKLGKKLAAAGQGAVYLALAGTTASFALGSGKDSGESTSDATSQVMKLPLGPLILTVVGIAVAVAGIVFVVMGIKRSFKKKLTLPVSGTARSSILWIGIAGYVAKGIVLLLVGVLFIVATVHARPEESTGVDGALKAVLEQPYGSYLLAFLGAGLMCYGLFLAIRSKYARM